MPTGYEVTNGQSVDVDIVTSNNCDDLTMTWSGSFTAQPDHRKDKYVVVK